MALRVTPAVLDEIAQHARECARHECCGILLAEPDSAGVVTVALRAGNAEPDDRTHRYLVDHQTQLAALDLEIDGRAEIVGYYHSHPLGAPVPSPTDIAQAVPDTVYLICGFANHEPHFAAWRTEVGAAVPVSLEPVAVAVPPDSHTPQLLHS